MGEGGGLRRTGRTQNDYVLISDRHLLAHIVFIK